LKEGNKIAELLDEWRPWKGNPSFAMHDEDLAELSKRRMELKNAHMYALLSVSK
jgi:hypothetical protein